MHEAMLYERREDGSVTCHLCAHRCNIRTGHKGICAVRENHDGTLYSLVYGKVISQAVDPIEKKPLFHFLPGSTSYSFACPGCNFRCQWCQNWQISQLPRLGGELDLPDVNPEAIVAGARRYGCASISYTYTEPTVYFEYAYDVMRLAHRQGLANVFVSNGYMTPECLDMLAPREGSPLLLDAANIDLKGWDDAFYRRFTGAHVEPVLESLRLLKHMGVWVEVTTLIIPTLNDDDAQLRSIASFIATDLGVDTPWHVTRFHPDFQMDNIGPTPVASLRRAHQIGLDAGLHYVYMGNIAGDGETTVCPGCGRELVSRSGFRVLQNSISATGTCPACSCPIAGVWTNPAAKS
jgi:pyruvate formate lyase activating enzyme